MKEINDFGKPEVSWLMSADPEPEKGLTNVLAKHQAGDPCIRSCHSHYGMWHSVAPAPVAWCILMSKMLWVRVTRPRVIRDVKTAINQHAVRGNVTVYWLFGIHLVHCAAAVSHFMFQHGEDDWHVVVRGHRWVVFYFKFNRKAGSKLFFKDFCANGTYIYWKKGNTYCVREEPTWMKSSKLFIQRGITSISITQLCSPHTLSPSTNRTGSSNEISPNDSHTVVISHSLWLISISCQRRH